MPSPQIDTSSLVAEVTRTKGLAASVAAFLAGVGAIIGAKVDEALAADDAADEGTAQAVRDAIAAAVSDLTGSNTVIADALAANPTGASPAKS